MEEGNSANVGATVALIAETEADIPNVKECGLECIVSGSGNRHDGTTAVDNSAASTDPAASTPAPFTPSGATSVPKPDVAELFMPALSSTMESGKIDEYYKEVGDEISAGDIVMAVESDKASMDVESFDSGILAHIVVDAGESANVGEAVAYLAKTKEDVPAVQAWASSLSTATAPAPAIEAPAPVAAPAPTTPETASPGSAAVAEAPVVNVGRIVASPYAKKIAKEEGVDLSRVVGTGPNGRIVAADVEKAMASGGAVAGAASGAAPAPVRRTDGKVVATPDAKKIAKKEKIDLASVVGTGNFGRITADDVLRAAGKAPAPAPAAAPAAAAPAAAAPPAAAGAAQGAAVDKPAADNVVPMTGMQKSIVKTMCASLEVPVFRVSYSIKTAALDELYAKLKPKGVSVSALLAKAVALTLTKHSIMNAAYEKDSIRYRSNINVAMAVAMPDGGLITPVLQNADTTDLYSLSRTWKDLVKRAMSGGLKPDEYNSGTFFISNLGMYGVESFDAILPPGAPSILAVGGSKPVVGLQDNGLIGAYKEMNVNITCDHRHIYGASAAEFLRDLADLLENNITELVM